MRLIALGFFLLCAAACAPDAERAAPTQPSGPAVDAVLGLLSAFNAHDASAMQAYWRDDVAWIEVNGDRSSLVTSSADQLRDELVKYFELFPTVSSTLSGITVNGDFLSAVETSVWEEGGVRKSQSSFVVYHVIDGKVRRFWYFPAQEETG